MAANPDNPPACRHMLLMERQGAGSTEDEEEDEASDHEMHVEPPNIFGTFDSFQQSPFSTFESYGEATTQQSENSSFDPTSSQQFMDDPLHQVGSPPMHPGVDFPAGNWTGSTPILVGAGGIPNIAPTQPYVQPGYMPYYYQQGQQQQQGGPMVPSTAMVPPTGMVPSTDMAVVTSNGPVQREEVDALILEKAALEAENAALRAYMALEAARSGAMSAVVTAARDVHEPVMTFQLQATAKLGGVAGGGHSEDGGHGKDGDSAPEVLPDETFHTLMLRNLPSAHGFSRDVLMGLLDQEGFKTRYDFIYAPIDFHTERLMGFAFVNFINHEEALRAKCQMDGFNNWGVQSKKVCEVRWGDRPMQGLAANIEHYRSSPVMHESVPEQYRPVVLADGVMQLFPPPTKKVRAPRLRHSGARKQ